MKTTETKEKKISPFLAITILFLEGSASIAIQFLALRQFVPFVGNSVLVTSIVISVFLGALALGYKKGGEVTEGHSLRLSKNLLTAAVLFGLFFSYQFLHIMFQYVYSGINPFIALSIHSLIFLFPPIYLIGQTIPLLVSFLSSKGVSQKTGNALLYSTLGNAVGGLTISGLSIYFWGVSTSIVIVSTILIALSFLVGDSLRKGAVVGLGLGGFIFIYGANIPASEYFFEKETHYANYNIVEAKKGGILIANNAFMSGYNHENKRGFPYVQRVKTNIKGYFSEKKVKEINLLVLGSGGFTFNYDKFFNTKRVTYVDIDSQIKSLVVKEFLKEPIDEKFVAQDGRSYLLSSGKTYDVIFVDAFTNKINIPKSMTSKEFYSLLRSKLKPGGIALINVVAEPFITTGWSGKIDNTINIAFKGQCVRDIVSFKKGNNHANMIYTCRAEGERKERSYYIDDKNNSDIDSTL